MKYVVVLGDGMADYPVAELGGKTPLQAAKKPGMDFIAKNGVIGLAKTVPESVQPGSDTANLSALGFNPVEYYTGRAPIEAVSMGVRLGDADVAFRCNLVSLSDEDRYEDKRMIDYSSDEITSEEASVLIEAVNAELLGAINVTGGTGGRSDSSSGGDGGGRSGSDISSGGDGGGSSSISVSGDGGQNIGLTDEILFYPGISYRHCMVWKGGGGGAVCIPPHDILTKRIGDYLPAGARANGAGTGDSSDADAKVLRALMRDSYDFLSAQKVNRDRIARGLLPANSLWLWGQGKRLTLASFYDKYKLSGAVISAVDLIKGIGISAGLRSIDVEGATGTVNTNYKGKAEAALKALDEGCDFVFIHIEAPDECGHRNEIDNKVKSIEYIDEYIVCRILSELGKREEGFSIMVLPDHPTPLSLRTHTRDPVPFAIYNSTAPGGGASAYSGGCGVDGVGSGGDSSAGVPFTASAYDEAEAAKSGLYIDPGHKLMDYFINGAGVKMASDDS